MLTGNLIDTITAIATGLGESGIGIVRISGKDALKISDAIFRAKDGGKPSKFKTYTVHYGWVADDRIIDEVILTVMRAPKSYTREDVVEINCHGGIVALRAVLELVLKKGARLAEPGEFTKRAFLNGRIDLAQAEAVLDIIRAKTDAALKIGEEQLKGALSKEINRLRRSILDILAVLEADIDFPEEDTGGINSGKFKTQLFKINSAVKDCLDSAYRGRIWREGVKIVICGKPNAGKSSLLNALLKQERSIVTPVAGTTRDTIEEVIDIKGIPVRIVDTAGIIEPRDLLEKKAVQRSKQQIATADLAILMFDASRKLTRDDRMLMRRLAKKPVIAVLNKIDLKEKIQRRELEKKFRLIVSISAKKMKNINLIEGAVAESVFGGRAVCCESAWLSNRRHIEKMRQAQKFIEEALNSLDNRMPCECIAQDLKYAAGCMDAILGADFSHDLLDKIFSEFCIGK